MLRHLAIEEFPGKVEAARSAARKQGLEFNPPAPLSSTSHFHEVAASYGELCFQIAQAEPIDAKATKKLLRTTFALGSEQTSGALLDVGTTIFNGVGVAGLSKAEWADTFICNLRSFNNVNNFGYGLKKAELAGFLTHAFEGVKSSGAEHEGTRPYALTQIGMAGLLFGGKLHAAFRDAPKTLDFAGIASTRMEYRAAKQCLLGGDGTALATLAGIARYRDFADSYAGGEMRKAYQLLSAVAQMENRSLEFTKLGWQAFPGSTTEYLKIVNALTTTASGIAGYRAFADSYAGGEMQKAYALLSAVAQMENRSLEFTKLGWQAFPGSTTEYLKIVDALKTAPPGSAGQCAFADEHTLGQPILAYRLLSAAAHMEGRRAEFDALEWRSL